MVAIYEFDPVSKLWILVAVFNIEADADFYVTMRRRYEKNVIIRKDVYNAKNG